ncbi:hypothetical protein [Roseovarius sp. EL26]|uniref:hypothetical protein n=1 Tax=Roseovarius sp. EL26 TaxID=2126672 RepID=UPI000EA3DC02|nr:hypothetical protein [Roseovarius sp. EL26]
MLRVITAMFTITAAQLHAGAWPRDEGQVFLSFSVESETEFPYRTYSALYVEYGATDKLTFGLDIGGDTTEMSKAIAFFRYPGKTSPGGLRTAWELGIGLADGDFAFRPGISYGLGIKWGEIDGWLGLETRSIIFTNGLAGTFEADATLGLSISKRNKLIFQLQSGMPPLEQTYIKIAPSLVREQSPGRHLEIGAAAGVMGTDEFKIKIGTWRQF